MPGHLVSNADAKTHSRFFLFGFVLIIMSCILNACGSSNSNHDDTKTMAAIMDSVRQKHFHHQNIFNSEAKLAHADSLLKHIMNPADRLRVEFDKAGYLLECGRESEAVALYEQLLKSPAADPKDLRFNILPKLGMAYLRLAERENCVGRHNADACILPIQGNGVHQLRTGAENAARIFEMVLDEYPDNLDARWLLNISYMTLGEYPASVPKKWLIPGLEDKGNIPVKPFIDIASDLGIAANDRAGGSIVEDFNNDGYLDIVTSAWGLDDPMHFFKNNGDGTFTDHSTASGLNQVVGGLNMTHTDYNNDGYADIFVLRGAWQGFTGFGAQPKSLLRNNGDGTFTDVTIEAGLLSLHPTQTAAWNDFNKDGWLDVFIGHETSNANQPHPCELYINQKNGTFIDILKTKNVIIASFVKGVTSGDYDNDGWPDIFFTTMDGIKVLLRNTGATDGSVGFENTTEKAGFSKEISSCFPSWFFDFDNDGWLDLCTWNYQFEQNLSYYAAQEALHLPGEIPGKGYLYHNNGDGTFTNVTAKMELIQGAYAMGSNFGDIDNDGYLDMYIGTGNPNFESLVPNKLFKNIEGKKFADITAAARVGNLQKGHGVSFADIDNDGDQDLYMDMGGAFRGDAFPSAFYVNPGQNQNRWICMKLEGRQTNRAAIGAKVTVRFKENGVSRSVYREVNSGGSFGGSPFRREIGIGMADHIDEIIIDWPVSGAKQTLKDIKPNQFIRIQEGKEGFEVIELKKLAFFYMDANGKMCATGQQIEG